MYATDRESLERDCDIEFIVAGGPGGQHRNKVESGVRMKHRPSGLVVLARERRSQSANRDEAYKRMAARLEKLNHRQKPRIATRPGSGAVERRLEEKRKLSERKARRRTADDD
jgi:protein subunit release factor B